MPIDDDPVTAALFDFVEQWTGDVERGERFGLEHYLERFPGHTDAIRAEFESLAAAAAPATAPAIPTAGRRIGPYEIVRELGRGGQGAVYLARDTRLAREVALKILPPAAFVTETRLRRFRREAEVVAGLSHHGICDVLEADFAGDLPYIAMRFVPGVPIHRAIADLDLPERQRIRRAIELGVHVARALHVAHEAGVVHRDIKPGNILVTPEGGPVLLDFGLAREVDDQSLTEPGSVFGTLHYMAPEQLREEALAAIDRRVDVYALAVTLYELTAGRRPFEAQTREVLALKIRNEPPVDPRTFCPAIPGDLGVVLAKALEKDPRRRYPTALALAEDLERVLRYEPILARPAGTLLKLRRWAQRHPLLSVSTALATLLLTAGLIVALVLLEQVRGERERYKGIFYATHARKLVEQDPTFALLTAVEAAAIERSFQAHTALYEALAACREEHRLMRDERYREVVVHAGALRAALISNSGACEVADLGGPDRPVWTVPTGVHCAAFDPPGRRLVTGGTGGEVVLFDAASGERLLAMSAGAVAVRQVRFSADGKVLLAAGEDGGIRLLDAARGEQLGRLEASARVLKGLEFGGRDDRLLTLDEAGVLRSDPLPRAAAGSERALPPAAVFGEDDPVLVFEPAPRGELVAFATATEVRLVDLQTGQIRWSIPVPRADVLAFDPAGARLAACCRGRLVVRSVREGRSLIDQAVHRDQLILDVAFSPDGELLATGGVDSSVRVFAAHDGTLLHDFRSLKPHVLRVHFTPDMRRLIGVGNNEHVLVYRLDERPGLLTLHGHTAGIATARYSPDGTRLLSASLDGTLRVWDRDGRALRVFAHGEPVLRACWSLDGQAIVTVAESRTVRVWSTLDRAAPVVLPAEDVFAADFDAAGRVWTIARAGLLRRWERSGVELPLPDEVAATAFPVSIAGMSNTGDLLAIGHDEPRVSVVRLRDVPSRSDLGFASAHHAVAEPRVFALRFSPSRRLLAVGGQDTSVRLFETSTLAPQGSYASSTPGCIAFDPAESRLVVGAVFNPTVAVLAIENGELRLLESIRDHRSRVAAVDFHPDGSVFLSASNDGTVRLYHTADRRKYAVLTAHTDAVTAAEFSPDGASIMTASLDGTVRLWPMDPLALARQRLTRGMNDVERRRLARDLGGQ